MKTIDFLLIALTFSYAFGHETKPIPECGTIQKKKTEEGIYEKKTVCTSKDIWVIEYLNGKRHGEERIYNVKKNLVQIGHFRNGEYHDTSVVWDSNGVRISKRSFIDGQSVGGDTTWFSNGKIQTVSNFDSTGTPDGYWYRNYDEGHLEYEQHWAEGACTSQVEYYRNGKVRLKMRSPISSKDAFFGKKVTSAESYSWSGKRIGKVVKGKGKIYLLPRDFNDFAFPNYDGKPTVGYIEVYQDSNLVKVHQIDSTAIEKFRW